MKRMNKKGTLIVLSGFSGAGKGTLVKGLCSRYEEYALSISATTRKPREGEKDGEAYFFKSVEEFENMISQNEFIEYARYVENYYGTPRPYVEQKLNEGKNVILEIEIQGALKVKEKFPDALFMFVMTPDADTLKKRLTGRGTETEEVIASRLSRAVEEAQGIENYDYLIINDDLDTAIEQMHGMIQSERFKVARNREFIEQLRAEMTKFSKGE